MTSPTETVLQRHILRALNAQPDVWAMRVNAGMVKRVRLAPEGTADIVGIGPGGVFFGIECKRPREEPSKVQQLWLQRVRNLGGFAAVARSVSDAMDVVRQMRRRWRDLEEMRK